MSSIYTGNPTNAVTGCAQITTPADADAMNAESVNAGLAKLADYVAQLKANIGELAVAALPATAASAPAGTYRDVIWVPSLSLFVAVGNNCSATSVDGKTWIPSSSPPTGSFMRLAYGPGGILAVGASCAAISGDGSTWVTRSIPAGTYYDVAFNGTIFCAVGASVCATLDNVGMGATARAIGAFNWHGIGWSGSKFAVVANDGAHATTSPDGTTWTPQTLPAGLSGGDYEVVWTGTQFVACGASCYISPDGVTWTVQSGYPALVGSMPRMAWNGTLFVVADDRQCFTSADAITWTVRTTPATMMNIAWGAKRFCFVGSSLSAITPQISV